MAALLINSFPLSVTEWRPSTEELGERGRAFSGRLVSSFRAIKHAWAGKVISADAVETEAIRSLLEGEGFSWSFDADQFSDGKGLPWIAANGSTFVTSPTPKFGAKCLNVPTGATVYFQGAIAKPYTVAFWIYESAAWHHYVVRSDGTTTMKWRDGARNDGASTPYVTVNSSAQLALSGQGGAANQFDDVVWVPCLWPTTWPPLLYARATAFPPLPMLEAQGELLPSSSLLYSCRGEATEGEAINRGGPISSRLETLGFRLAED